MSSSHHIPQRTCLGCGQRAPQSSLLRIAVDASAQLVTVSRRQVSGRSGYLHRAAACWQRFAARKGQLRSLGRNVEKQERAAFLRRIEHSEGELRLAEVTGS